MYFSCLLFSLSLRPPLFLSTIYNFFCSLIKSLLSAGLYPYLSKSAFD